MTFGLSAGERLRWAVLSPHLDDAILSLGASIADAVGCGHEVSVVTVFAGDPTSQTRAGDWDGRAGFATAGAAAEARREEDRRACELLGARTDWLNFDDDQYADTRDGEAVWSALSAAVEPADVVLVPGRPLIHPDHLWVARLVAAHGVDGARVGYYAELPYDLWGRSPNGSAPVTEVMWSASGVTLRSRARKWHACGAYSSQLPWLGRGSPYRRALLRSRLGGESVGWADG